MNVVVDASVVLKWLVVEDDSQAALLVRVEHDVAAPDVLFIECRNVLLTKVRRRQLKREQAEEAESALDEFALGIAILPSSAILRDAFMIALDLEAPVYDCIYLAAARTTERILITADERFAAKASQSRFGENQIEVLK